MKRLWLRRKNQESHSAFAFPLFVAFLIRVSILTLHFFHLRPSLLLKSSPPVYVLTFEGPKPMNIYPSLETNPNMLLFAQQRAKVF
ncbi:hypothetical protein M438DRAFT_215752 [Aureobasidium pullulans EXF-150]|uniref:Uncharacterized protein n=1 Tax=Aureobasidium pullulans EXF-150 TaxID=1043002 RepID=A0A074XLG4_AURPU|nr:uncharacterized protein M438DRAFT_215752 [Aureobasidium pullulans EXF-150]KEQ84544.1 hypothetical protein M438DRAFT_215752 [Aureobasidium pullulans EXF-150]